MHTHTHAHTHTRTYTNTHIHKHIHLHIHIQMHAHTLTHTHTQTHTHPHTDRIEVSLNKAFDAITKEIDPQAREKLIKFAKEQVKKVYIYMHDHISVPPRKMGLSYLGFGSRKPVF
jgi:hypothetical protein